VGVLLLDRCGRVFVGRRVDAPEAWQMPQGGIDAGESPREAAFRELREEIGTDRAHILAESRDWLAYDLPPGLADRVWGGRFRGQRQKWFVMRFEGAESDIRLDAHTPEFTAWRWVAPDALPGLIVPFKRPLYEALLAEFATIIAASSCADKDDR